MNRTALAIVALLPFCVTGARANSSQEEPLATIAHRLGFVYAYLATDDVVSLVGHGISVIVRPGVAYFTVNDRVVPVEGDAPRYQSGDLSISPAFSHQLTMIERAAAKRALPSRAEAVAENPAHINVATASGLPQNVTAVSISAVPGSDDISVNGEATPGALVAIVLKATLDPLLPAIFLNRSFAVATTSGAFALKIPTAPDYFTGSVLIAEVSGIDDMKPMSTTYSPPGK